MSVSLHLGTLTPAEIAEAVGGRLEMAGGEGTSALTVVSSVSTDSRDCPEGTLFVAIRGERTDGHAYLADVCRRGAACALVSYIPRDAVFSRPFPCIVVEDTVRAVGLLARAYRTRSSCRIAAITGSVGKTTTKEFVAAVLSQKFKTYKSSGNHNNELGLPLVLLGMPAECEWAVLEMGMSALGEIDHLTRIARPDIALITNIGTSHLEYLGSRENICRAKMEIVNGLKSDGTLLLNGDEPLLAAHRGDSHSPQFVSLQDPSADFYASAISCRDNGQTFCLTHAGKTIRDLTIPVLGEHNVYAAAFACAVGLTGGLSEEEIRRGLAGFVNVGGRQNLSECGGIAILDDCYNASPESMRAALKVLDQLSRQRGGARRVALLGDMRELGRDSRALHTEVGRFAASCTDLLFTFGVLAMNIADGAEEAGMSKDSVFSVTDMDHESCGKALLSRLRPGDILLVKASRAMEEEKIIAYIREHLPDSENKA